MSPSCRGDRHNRRSAGRIAAILLAFASAPAALAQQCRPPATSNEADLLGTRSLSLAMSRGTALNIDSAGSVRVGGEIVFLPKIDRETAQPTTCRPGKDAENVNTLKVAGRIRASIALPRHLVAEVSWLPPVEIKGIEGNVLGLALGGVRRLTDRWLFGLRGHATFGSVSGPFTCPASAVTNSASECAGGSESNDTFNPNMFGADASLGFNAPTSRFAWFAGAGYSRLMPRFQVNFRDAAGVLDTTRVIVDMNRVALFAGVTTSVGHRLRGSAEFYATTRDGATGRIIVDALMRRGK